MAADGRCTLEATDLEVGVRLEVAGLEIAEPADVAELAERVGMKYRPGARGQFSHSNIITVLNPEGEIVRQQTGLNQNIEEMVTVVQQIAAR